MKFFCVSAKTKEQTSQGSDLDLLRMACEENGIEFIHIESDRFDFTDPPALNPGDALYRSSMGAVPRAIERFLIHDHVSTFYPKIERAFCDYDDLFFHKLHHLPVPKTIYGVANKYDLLKKYSEYLGGFPLVLKILGKSVGAGVIKIDSLDGLSAIVRLVGGDPRAKFVLKSFIETAFSVRVIVVGKEAIGAISYQSRRGDFRTNVEKDPLKRPYALSDELRDLAVSAVESLDLEFGGVDILIDATGKMYLAEVNSPCVFSDVQETTGIPIATLMVQYLKQKPRSKK